MNYSIRIFKTKNQERSTKAYASVTFNKCFIVTGITVRENKNGELFVSMPSYKSKSVDDNGKPVYKEYCNPTTKEFRDELYGNILKNFKEGVNEYEVKGLDDKMQIGISLNTMSGTNLEAIGRVYLNKCFVRNNVKVMTSEKGSFVAMPSLLANRGDEGKKYEDVCFPITKEFRTELYNAILSEKEKVYEKMNEEFMQVDKALDGVETPFR